jgi:hypothetical protein
MASLLDFDDSVLSAIVASARDPYDMLGLARVSRRLRDIVRADRARRWPGWQLVRMTPQKKWKYAAMRELYEQMSEACDEGARDVARYAGTRATLDECREAWCARFGVWRASHRCDELGVIRAIMRGVVPFDQIIAHPWARTARILKTIGKFARDGDVIDMIGRLDDSNIDDADKYCVTVLYGVMRALRNELARDVIVIFYSGTRRDDLAKLAIRAHNEVIFRDHAHYFDCGGNYGYMCLIVQHCAGWACDDDIARYCNKAFDGERGVFMMLLRAVKSDDPSMCTIVRESFARNYDAQTSQVTAPDVAGAEEECAQCLPQLVRIAARRGHRAMCTHLLAWAIERGVVDLVAREMLRVARLCDHYWIMDMVCVMMRAIRGPGRGMVPGHHGRCCALLARGWQF